MSEYLPQRIQGKASERPVDNDNARTTDNPTTLRNSVAAMGQEIYTLYRMKDGPKLVLLNYQHTTPGYVIVLYLSYPLDREATTDT